MSNLKSDIKQLVTNEVGVRIEDALEVAKKDLASVDGKCVAFNEASKAAESLLVHVDKDVDENKYDPAVAEHVKRYILRMSNALMNMANQAKQLSVIQQGKVLGLEYSVKIIENMLDLEKKKANAQEQLKLAGQGEDHRPIPREVSFKEQRLAEDKLKIVPDVTTENVKAKDVEVLEETSSVPKTVEPQAEPPRRRRGIKSNAVNS